MSAPGPCSGHSPYQAQAGPMQTDHADPQTTAIDPEMGDHDPIYLPPPPPPFLLVGRVLQKLRQDNVKRAVLIAPVWKGQVWYPSLCGLLNPVRNSVILLKGAEKGSVSLQLYQLCHFLQAEEYVRLLGSPLPISTHDF